MARRFTCAAGFTHCSHCNCSGFSLLTTRSMDSNELKIIPLNLSALSILVTMLSCPQLVLSVQHLASALTVLSFSFRVSHRQASGLSLSMSSVTSCTIFVAEALCAPLTLFFVSSPDILLARKRKTAEQTQNYYSPQHENEANLELLCGGKFLESASLGEAVQKLSA